MATPSCSFANLLTGNKLGCKIFRGVTGHAFEGHNGLAIVQLVLNRQPRQAFLRGVLHDHIFFRTADDSPSKLLNGLQFSNILICDIRPNIPTVVHFAEGQGVYYS